MKQVTVYGAEWCGYCHAVRKWLDKKEVPYTYVDTDIEGREAMHAAIPNNETIPVVVIEGEAHINPSYVELTKLLISNH
jgi:glutaredoxin